MHDGAGGLPSFTQVLVQPIANVGNHKCKVITRWVLCTMVVYLNAPNSANLHLIYFVQIIFARGILWDSILRVGNAISAPATFG